jgi:hypothetical protein
MGQRAYYGALPVRNEGYSGYLWATLLTSRRASGTSLQTDWDALAARLARVNPKVQTYAMFATKVKRADGWSNPGEKYGRIAYRAALFRNRTSMRRLCALYRADLECLGYQLPAECADGDDSALPSADHRT